jgi:hypothetical protein
VNEIREHDDKEFQYVNTTRNPADIASRGCTLSKLEESMWWNGPKWLQNPIESWTYMYYQSMGDLTYLDCQNLDKNELTNDTTEVN